MGDSCDFEFLSTIHAFVGRLDDDFFFWLDVQCLSILIQNGVAKCQKSDVTNFYIRLVLAPRTPLSSLRRCWTILNSWLLKLKTNALHATFCATCIFWVFPHLQTLKAENASFSEQICCILLLHCSGKGVPSSILNPPMGNKVTEKTGLGLKNPPLVGNIQKLRIKPCHFAESTYQRDDRVTSILQ